jgi:protein AATF/BFR2
LLETNGEINPPPRKRVRVNHGGDYAATVSASSKALAEVESAYDTIPPVSPHPAPHFVYRYHPHLTHTLSKWSNKIQSVAPSVLLPSNRNAFTKSSRNEIKNAVQLISESLSDRASWTKVVDRTRVYRGKGERIGYKLPSQATEPNPEVFDDTDFYQQLLRDVIDARNGGSANQDWVQAQKERKKKKVVDTKASKGRKIR